MFHSFNDVCTVLVAMGFKPAAKDTLIYGAGSFGVGYTVTVSYKYTPRQVRRNIDGKVISCQREAKAYTIEVTRWDCNWDDEYTTMTQVVNGHMNAFKAIVAAL